MAYGFIISAVRENEFLSFKAKLNATKKPFFGKRKLTKLHSEKVVVTTHYFLSFGTGNNELDVAMKNLLDAGEKISDFYWHPLRVPFYQGSAVNKAKISKFKFAYGNYLSSLSAEDYNYFSMEFSPIIKILDFISSGNLGLITFLEKPQDKERADKVIYPI